MQKLKLLFLASLTLITILLLKKDMFQKALIQTPLETQQASVSKGKQTLGYQMEGVSVYMLLVKDMSQIKLYSNLEDKLTAASLLVRNGCQSLVSGGFYTKQEKHIGYFYTNGELISEKITNPFYNGYFGVLSQKNAFIAKDLPTKKEFAVQSGPLLIYEGVVQKLKLTNDEPARRVLVASNKLGSEIYFLIFFNTKSTLLGPTLEELPAMLVKFADENNLELYYALNLDGGAHSTFITKDVKVSELSPIGGYFCITEEN